MKITTTKKWCKKNSKFDSIGSSLVDCCASSKNKCTKCGVIFKPFPDHIPQEIQQIWLNIKICSECRIKELNYYIDSV